MFEDTSNMNFKVYDEKANNRKAFNVNTVCFLILRAYNELEKKKVKKEK